VDQVMGAEPYASAKRVFWVVDNGASHRNWAAAARLSDSYPNAQTVHLPVHASWLNQAGVYFSVIQRKLFTPDDFEGWGAPDLPDCGSFRIFTRKDGITWQGNTGSSRLSSVRKPPAWWWKRHGRSRMLPASSG
jgi:hypothetical protein